MAGVSPRSRDAERSIRSENEWEVPISGTSRNARSPHKNVDVRGNPVPVGERLTGVSRIVLCVVTVALVVGCGDSSSTGGGGVEPVADDSLPVVDLFEQPVADASEPADRAGAAAGFIDCEYGISQGGWSPDFGAPGSASDPDRALLEFVDGGLFALPTEGYVAEGRDQDRRLYTYSVEGEAKVAVIVADSTNVPLDAEDGWVVETFASCDPAEYDPTADDQIPMDIWLDADGNRVPTSIITSSQGPEHCDWQSVTFLWFDDRQFIGDPEDALWDVEFVAPYRPDTDLPSDATDTGYHHDTRHLWLSADGTVAYLVGDNRVEAWPSSTELIGCA